MGADIPMAVGECIATGKRTICVTGDGGALVNCQAFANVRDLPIEFYILDNGGYASIEAMQDARFTGRHVGCNRASGLPMPDLRDVAEAFGAKVWMVDARGWKIEPYCATSSSMVTDPLEDMTPHLPADELKELMDYGN